ncbi:MAG TPA: DUF4430 domain-containing protein [Capillimicrobium sp.]|nr:DUF4430 domain-containing protein [Capillimicrobium sp.]
MRRAVALLAVVAAALGAAGCGLGAGEGSDDVELTVTRDFGATAMSELPPSEVQGSETVMRYLQRTFDVETRYGGGFVQSINGIAGGRVDGRPVDWFYYVNGVEADKGSTSTKIYGGDRIWWDHHDWGATMRVPAVVGSYPEPFVHGLGGKKWPTRVECVKNGDKAPCEAVSERLGDEGVIAAQSLTGTSGGTEQLRVVVGPWSAVSSDYAAQLIDEGPQASGVYARFVAGGRRLELLDERGRVVRTAGPGTGLIAATRWEDQPPTWFVTGTDAAGVEAAVQALDEATLHRRFAVAVVDGRPVALPVEAPER